MQPLISVIIPVYNNGNYIKKCIQSLREQTYSNIEILLIDDGSDSEYSLLYDEIGGGIRVYHESRAGVSRARNTGLKYSKGDYVCFVDSDDYVAPEFCERLMELIQKYDVRIAACGYKRVKDEKGVPCLSGEAYRISKEGKWLNILQSQHSAEGFLWNKMYSKNLLKDCEFDESLFMCEDQLFVFRAVSNTEDIAVSTEQLYFYRVNSAGSAMHNLKEEDFMQRIYVANKIFEIIKQDGNESTVKEYERLLFDGYFQYCRYLAGYRPDKWKQKYKTQREKATSCISDDAILNKTCRLLVKSNTGFIMYSWLRARARNIKIKIERLKLLM